MKLTILLLLISSSAFGQLVPGRPNVLNWPGNEYPKQFIRLDTTKGLVVYPTKSPPLTVILATRIDSLFKVWAVYYDNGIGYQISEERKTKSIKTSTGKIIDLTRQYEFYPENRYQQ